MLSAGRIFFPTPRFVKIFEAAGKSTFPNGFTYKIRKSRVVEEVLFQFLACPHPRTRIYFGRQKKSIPEHFSFPFLAMGANKSGTAHLLRNAHELEELAVRHQRDFEDKEKRARKMLDEESASPHISPQDLFAVDYEI